MTNEINYGNTGKSICLNDIHMKYDSNLKSMDKFQTDLEKLNLSLSKNQLSQFLHYYKMLIEWNKVMNLTAITDFEEVIEKHFIDSLCLVKVIPDLSDQKILDLGTGAGFPGIPLKIVFPDLKIVLVDSLSKRISFLNEVIHKLNLSNTDAVHGRAEDLARKKEYRQQFDLCVSRAVSNLSVLSEYCIPFVKMNGFFISYKSAEINQEIEEANKAIFLLGGVVDQVTKFYLPESESGRSLVCIKKIRNTSKTYPRKAGIPIKQPIR